jgi:para-aminobenzoate synthetase/4-amino-4-deoxychorismate lyase
LLFREPVEVITACSQADVVPALEAVEAEVSAGRHAAGFVTYEASPGLDKAMETHSTDGAPLVWFGIFERPEEFCLADDLSSSGFGVDADESGWIPSISKSEYGEAISRIKDYLKAGDTYQVNYTLRLRNQFNGDPWDLFLRLCRTQRAKYCAFIETDEFAVCSASPELFFSLTGERLLSRPMKGTSKRGLTLGQDRDLADALLKSEKNRAENVMIVDMVRNDMGRIAFAGSVEVERMYDIERYPTVLQMTSTVACRTAASFLDIMKALFPCASITGAPKVRTMQIIKELEHGTRGIYTGCVGYVAPGRDAMFNVAIRTVTLDKGSGSCEYGVGGGIVWDSDAGNEHDECLVKSAVLKKETPDFDLIESFLWEEDKGYFLMDRHMKRLKRSAEYFGFDLDMAEVEDRLMKDVASMEGQNCKVRLHVNRTGHVLVERTPIGRKGVAHAWKVKLSDQKVKSDDPFLYHKTTIRGVYERARLTARGYDDVLLWNERGEVTESTVANVVVSRNGTKVTPPVQCGLLPGIFREWLIDNGDIEEGIVGIEDLKEAEEVFLINSVRKWIPVTVTLPEHSA